jgi:hypothetical protein
MEISVVRNRLRETMERAKRQAAERRAHADRTASAFDTFLTTIAVPLVRQIANVLRAEGHVFSVFTPSGSVRLMSDKRAEDFIEITLDTTSHPPRVMGHISRAVGRRGIDAERVVASGDPAALSEDDLLAFFLEELEPFVER